MMRIINLLVLIYALECCYAKNSCSNAELEKHLAPIVGVFGMRGIKFPESKNELDQTCRVQERSAKLAKDYSALCLKGLSKTIMSVTIYTTSKIQKRLCNKQFDDLINAGQCGNRGKKETIKCWTKLIDKLNVIKNNISDARLKIPLVCCNFFEWKTCTLNVFTNIGAPVCSDSVINRFDNLISRGSIDALKVACGDYTEESDKCDKVIKQMPNIKIKARHEYKTPFVPVFEIYESI